MFSRRGAGWLGHPDAARCLPSREIVTVPTDLGKQHLPQESAHIWKSPDLALGWELNRSLPYEGSRLLHAPTGNAARRRCSAVVTSINSAKRRRRRRDNHLPTLLQLPAMPRRASTAGEQHQPLLFQVPRENKVIQNKKWETSPVSAASREQQ